jgi:hypothetical protein
MCRCVCPSAFPAWLRADLARRGIKYSDPDLHIYGNCVAFKDRLYVPPPRVWGWRVG